MLQWNYENFDFIFQFDHEKYDFWKIYDSIKRYYPIGISRQEDSIYHSYPGLRELGILLTENLHDSNMFESCWVDFTKDIKLQIGNELIDTTHSQMPCFSSYVLLDSVNINNHTRTKEIHFFVSLIGPYFTIIGKDKNTVKIENANFHSVNYLVLSPEAEFGEVFSHLYERIITRFAGYTFVPFAICRQRIVGLEVSYSDECLNRVFNALFNNQISFDGRYTIGNPDYRIEDWIKEGYVEKGNQWTAYPPTFKAT